MLKTYVYLFFFFISNEIRYDLYLIGTNSTKDKFQSSSKGLNCEYN